MAGEKALTEAERATVKQKLDEIARELGAVGDEALRAELHARIGDKVKVPSKETFRKARLVDARERAAGWQLVRVIEAFSPGWRLQGERRPEPPPLAERAATIPSPQLPIAIERAYAVQRALGRIDEALERLARLYLPQFRGTPSQDDADTLVEKSIALARAHVESVSTRAHQPPPGRVALELDHVPQIDATHDRPRRKRGAS